MIIDYFYIHIIIIHFLNNLTLTRCQGTLIRRDIVFRHCLKNAHTQAEADTVHHTVHQRANTLSTTANVYHPATETFPPEETPEKEITHDSVAFLQYIGKESTISFQSFNTLSVETMRTEETECFFGLTVKERYDSISRAIS